MLKRPLIEAILHLQWDISLPAPAYNLVTGRFYDKVHANYPRYESLEAFAPTGIPNFPKIPMHRFRREQGNWPLIQLGDGMLSYHDVEETYPGWKTFCASGVDVVRTLLAAVPEDSKFRAEHLSLRYIDAIRFDPKKGDVQKFLSDKLGVHASLKAGVVDTDRFEAFPTDSALQVAYRCKAPKGNLVLASKLGTANGDSCVILETMLSSSGSEIPSLSDGFKEWADQAHDVVSNVVFKKLLEGMKEEYPDVFK